MEDKILWKCQKLITQTRCFHDFASPCTTRQTIIVFNKYRVDHTLILRENYNLSYHKFSSDKQRAKKSFANFVVIVNDN